MAKAERKPKVQKKKLPTEVSKAVRAALDKKAADVVVLDLRNTSAFTDFFILCSGSSQRQVKAIADLWRKRSARRRCVLHMSRVTTGPTGS